MSLSFIYSRYIEMCVEMAAASKSREIREQWTKLGEQWREKAAADEHRQDSLHTATRNLTPTSVLEAPPVQKPEATANYASASELKQQGHEAAQQLRLPTLIPDAAPVQQKSEPTSQQAALSDIWATIASPINLEN